MMDILNPLNLIKILIVMQLLMLFLMKNINFFLVIFISFIQAIKLLKYEVNLKLKINEILVFLFHFFIFCKLLIILIKNYVSIFFKITV